MFFLNSKILTALLSALSVWILFSVISTEAEKDDIKKEEAAIESKISSMKRDNETLEEYVQNLKNPKFLEKEARLRLNYKASGEEAVFVHRDPNSQKASLSDGFDPENLPNYKKWWYWLFGY